MKLRFVLARTFHQFNSHLWHVLFVWCVRWSFAVMRARSIRFLLSFVPLRTERKHKMPVIYINRFLLCVASRARAGRLTFGQWFSYWFYHFNEFQTIFCCFCCELPYDHAMAIPVPPSPSMPLMHMEFLCSELDCCLSQQYRINRRTHSPNAIYIFPFSMKNY